MSAASAWRIRRLDPPDAAAYRSVRLDALRLHPSAYSSSHEEEVAYSLDDFARMLPSPPSATLGAFAGDDIVGIAGLRLQTRLKQRHKGFVFGVYVDAAYRGAGIACELVAALITEARREKLRLLQLTVTVGNDSALRIYTALGFRTYGVEHRALLVDGVYYDEELMELNLD